uniref:Uncharacterized protein n=1 Tax=Buteo japonicus TaxID=224669 RepID=A0A8C0C0B0_9AVES
AVICSRRTISAKIKTSCNNAARCISDFRYSDSTFTFTYIGGSKRYFFLHEVQWFNTMAGFFVFFPFARRINKSSAFKGDPSCQRLVPLSAALWRFTVSLFLIYVYI